LQKTLKLLQLHMRCAKITFMKANLKVWRDPHNELEFYGGKSIGEIMQIRKNTRGVGLEYNQSAIFDMASGNGGVNGYSEDDALNDLKEAGWGYPEFDIIKDNLAKCPQADLVPKGEISKKAHITMVERIEYLKEHATKELAEAKEYEQIIEESKLQQ
jgi:hypothetical protein